MYLELSNENGWQQGMRNHISTMISSSNSLFYNAENTFLCICKQTTRQMYNISNGTIQELNLHKNGSKD